MQSVKQFVGILLLLGVVTTTGYVALWFYERHERHATRGQVDPNLVKELTRLEQGKRNH